MAVLAFSIIPILNHAQDQYIVDWDGNGPGQYGYLEYDALTYATLNRNNHDYVDYLAFLRSAR